MGYRGRLTDPISEYKFLRGLLNLSSSFMSDRKSTRKKRQPMKSRKKSKRPVDAYSPPIGLPLNSMFLKGQWYFGALNTSTSGTIARGSISPSISFSSEYSVVQNLFTEIRLIAATIIFTPTTMTESTLVQGRLMVGTNMLFNGTTFTTPTSATGVQNTTHPIDLCTYGVRPVRYRMVVPSSLEYSSVTGDIPTIPTPYAGSPGCVVVWGDNLTVSTNYFQVDIHAIWHLRGRQ